MSGAGIQLGNAAVVLAVIAVCGSTSSCLADVVYLKTGAEVQCEVVRDEPASPLLIRVKESGAAKTYTINRDRVDRVARELPDAPQSTEQPAAEDGLSSANGARAPSGGTGKLRKCADLLPVIEQALPDREEGAPEVVVVHLSGQFDHPRITDIGSVISAGEFQVMMDVARERNPDAIVLAIDSPGGLISEMDEIIDYLIAVQSHPHNERVVAWVDLGGSAAALTSLACKEIVMVPQGRAGAATAVISTGEAVPSPGNAMDHKREAMRQARRKQIASLTNRPLLIQEAMEFPKRLLWAHEFHGFTSTKPDDAEWTALDDSTEQPMALDADTMVRFNIAQGMAGSTEELLDVLGLPLRSKVVHIDLKDEKIQEAVRPLQSATAKEWACVRALDKRIEKAINQVILAMRTVRGIGADADGFILEDVRRLQVSIRNCRVPAVDRSVRTVLGDDSADLLRHYERKLSDAREMVSRASMSISQRSDTLPVDDIQHDLNLAREFLIEALVGDN